MNEKIKQINERTKGFWKERTMAQKAIFIGSVAIVLLIGIVFVFMSNNEKYVTLYTDLSLPEMNQVKAALDTRNIAYEIVGGGTTVKVPESRAEELLVDLAGENIPSSGNIDFSFFSQNASWGITDNEFSMIKLDAMRSELAKLIKSVEGITDANVMITLPQESVFLNDQNEQATASIVIQTEYGHEFKENQIDSLYHLVSSAIPNLPKENIIIRNQYLEYFDQNNASNSNEQGLYTYQQKVKQDTERDIQRRLQQMIGTMVGMEKVIVSVTADIDFTNENRIEELVTPVDLENMSGLPVSIEKISETYAGNPEVGGVTGSGEGDIPNFESVNAASDGDYEMLKETINNEFNRIRKEIVESPYKIRDLGVQVAIDNVANVEGDTIQYLSVQEQRDVEEGISSIIHSIISTSIDKNYGEINTKDKISIIFQEFSSGNLRAAEDLSAASSNSARTIPLWIYFLGTGLILVIIIVVFLMLRQKNTLGNINTMQENIVPLEESPEIPDLQSAPDNEMEIRKKQLEKLAQEKPEEFAKLLRSWMVED